MTKVGSGGQGVAPEQPARMEDRVQGGWGWSRTKRAHTLFELLDWRRWNGILEAALGERTPLALTRVTEAPPRKRGGERVGRNALTARA